MVIERVAQTIVPHRRRHNKEEMRKTTQFIPRVRLPAAVTSRSVSRGVTGRKMANEITVKRCK